MFKNHYFDEHEKHLLTYIEKRISSQNITKNPQFSGVWEYCSSLDEKKIKKNKQRRFFTLHYINKTLLWNPKEQQHKQMMECEQQRKKKTNRRAHVNFRLSWTKCQKKIWFLLAPKIGGLCYFRCSRLKKDSSVEKLKKDICLRVCTIKNELDWDRYKEENQMECGGIRKRSRTAGGIWVSQFTCRSDPFQSLFSFLSNNTSVIPLAS